MGAGKSTLGRLLAEALQISFIDLDHYLEQRFHKTVNELFAERGEAGFRDLEMRMLHEVGEFRDVVIATGGGTPCFFDNMAYMKRQGMSVYLKTSVPTLFSRLRKAAKSRPLLREKTDEQLLVYIADNLERRTPAYEQASLIFDTDCLESPRQIEDSLFRLKSELECHPVFVNENS